MGKLGYSSITLTDLTQTLPVSLTLESNLNKNIQIKTGTLYEPDFRKKISPEEDFEGVVITPSLFLGQEDLEIEKNEIYVNPNFNDEIRTSGFIYYEIGNTVYKYDKDITTGIFVDLQGRLHIEENLNENTTIEAYIENFKIETHGYTDPLVSAINPITILLLEEGSSNYQAMIDCSDGREHFEDTNASPITITASLWKGKEQIPAEQLLYSWDKLGDGDSIVDGDKSYLVVERKNITNREYFTCIITDTATGLTYSASQFIYDFTDIYACDISYDKMPLLTDKNTEITLTANVWNKGKLLESGKDGFILSYDWFARGIVSEEEVILIENNTSPILDLNVSSIPKLQRQDFVVYCKVYQTDSTGTRYPIAGGTLNIHYTVQYSVRITPQTFFIPTSNAGFYQGEESKKYNFTFQLLDSNGTILPYEEENSIIPVGNQSDGTIITFTQIEEERWNFTGEINFINSTLWEQTNLTSQIYEFTYTYLGQKFSEEINIVKSYAGEQGKQGEQGFSGYTIDLSNNFHAFSGGESIADPGQIAETDISAFYGDQNLEILEVKVDNNGDIIYSSNGENTPVSETNVENLLISARPVTENNSIRVTMKTGERGSSATTKGNTLTFIIRVKYPEKNEILNIVKTFTYIINYEGKSYYLNTDYNNIMYSEATGAYEPSPSQGINVYSLYRGEKGEALTYEIGKVIYSLDEGKTWNYLGGSSGRITNYSSLKNIQIRLYGSASTVDNNPNDLKNNEKYLYDMEAIPVLTSLEGYEIGGENLLKWTRDLTIETNKWYKDEDVRKKSEESFGIFHYYVKEELSKDITTEVWSPKSNFSQDFLGKTFCLSFYIKINSADNLSFKSFNASLVLNSEYVNTSKERFGNIFSIDSTGKILESIGTTKFMDDFEKDKWVRIYSTFTLPNVNDNTYFSSSSDSLISWNDCRYFSIYFSLINNGNVEIKKPKLELGNIPTSWSSHPEDDIFLNVSGANFFSNKIETTLSASGEQVSLGETGIYTISYQNIDSDLNYITMILYDDTTGDNGKSYYLPTHTKYDYSFDFVKQETESKNDNMNTIKLIPSYNGHNSTNTKISYLKLEKGFYSGWGYEPDDINKLLQEITVQFSNKEENLIDVLGYGNNELKNSSFQIDNLKITLPDGRIVSFLTLEDFKSYIKELYNTNLQGMQSWTSNIIALETEGYNTRLQQIENQVVINTNESEPYIEIRTKYNTTGETTDLSLRLTPTELGFYEGKERLAYFGSSRMYITHAQITNLIDFGAIDSNSFLRIKIGSNGVGFIWVDN